MAVKPRQYCFRSEILPSQLICVFFEMQGEKRTIMHRDDIDPMSGQDVYLQVSAYSNLAPAANILFLTMITGCERDASALLTESTRWVLSSDKHGRPSTSR